MDGIETMELSINEWEEIFRNHVVSCDNMIEFLEEIIQKSETQATLSIRRMKHTCQQCKKEFTDKDNLKRHAQVHAVKSVVFALEGSTIKTRKDCMKITVENCKC